MNMKLLRCAPISALFLGALVFACSNGVDECSVDETYDPLIDPADFATTIDNSLLPMIPGTKLVYQGGDETIEVSVTRDYTPLEPDDNENKYYCPGVGVALEVDINTGERTELIEVTTF